MSLVDFIQVCMVLLHFGTRHTLSHILSLTVHPIVSLWCWTTTANDGDRNMHAPPLSAALAARDTTKIWRA
jgi:hypothetical protein